MIPLPTMLSHALVGWTIEVDNAFELRMPHRTTAMRRRGDVLNGPWLVSFAMYVHCIRHLVKGGLTVGELKARARVGRPVSGLDRWGYVVVSEATRKSNRVADASKAIVRPTAAGLQAQAVWASLPDEIDAGWNDRYDEVTLSRLREALSAVVAALDPQWPDYLPGVRGSGDLLHHVRGGEPLPGGRQPPHPNQPVSPPDATELPLYALLSRVLLAFALEYEHDAELSILLAANLVRVLDNVGVPIADLPRLAGASKEAIALSLTVATRSDLVAVEKTPGKRTRQARLTPRGVIAGERHLDLISDIESRWAERFGTDVLRTMRSSLENDRRGLETLRLPAGSGLRTSTRDVAGRHANPRDTSALSTSCSWRGLPGRRVEPIGTRAQGLKPAMWTGCSSAMISLWGMFTIQTRTAHRWAHRPIRSGTLAMSTVGSACFGTMRPLDSWRGAACG